MTMLKACVIIDVVFSEMQLWSVWLLSLAIG